MVTEPHGISGRRFRDAFVLILVVAVSVLFLAVAWPFLKPLLLGALLAGLCHRLYRWITSHLGGRPSLGAIVTLILLFILVAAPLSIFLSIVVKQAVAVSNQALPWVQQNFGPGSTFNIHDWLVQKFPSLAVHIPPQDELLKNISEVAKATGGFLVGVTANVAGGTASFLLNLFVMLYAMFFFLRDGEKILEKIFYFLPLSHEDEALMLQRFASITRATIKGTIVIGIIQGFLAGLGLWAAGIEGAAFWGTIMTILSVLPGVGTALVWLPAVIFLCATGHMVKGLLLLTWCAAVVGTVDNLLRVILVGKDAEMPDLLILLGTLGGLFLFGAIGFIVGPIVCGLFLTVWDIYGATFKDILPPVKSLRAPVEKEHT